MTKKFIIFGIILFIVGALLTVSSMVVVGFDFSKLSTKERTYFEQNIDAKSSINIDIDSSKTRVILSDESTIKVSSYLLETETIIVEEKQGTVYIVKDTKFSFAVSFGFDFFNNEILIEIPRDLKITDFTLTAGSGNIIIDNINADDINVSCKSGSLKVYNVESDNFKSFVSSGNTTIDKAKVNQMNVQGKSGNIKLSNVEGNKITLTNNSGRIEVDKTKCNDILITNDSGRVQTNNLVSTNVTINVSSGNTYLYNTTVDNLKIDTKSGGVKCYLSGNKSDYSIFLNIKSGSSNISAQSGGEKNIDIKVSSGSVKVYFEQ